MEPVHLLSEVTAGVLPPIDDLVLERPMSWNEMWLHWRDDLPSPAFVFIRDFDLGDGRDVYLFGTRYDFSTVRVEGLPLDDGHFVEYFACVRDRDTQGFSVHRLLQRASVVFSEGSEVDDYVQADAVVDPASRSLGDPPNWKPASSQWPTYRGHEMSFVGQFYLGSNDVTKRFLTTDTAVFLFWHSRQPDGDVFKLVEQRPSQQTAEEHYELEERRDRRVLRRGRGVRKPPR